MKTKSNFVIIILFLMVSPPFANAQEATPEHKDSLNAVVDEYYLLNVKVFQAGSTVKDIEEIFALFTDDFEYVHPKYGGTYSRQVLYDGYVRNQKNGRYNGSVVDIRVVSKISGLNAVVTEKIFLTKEEGKVVEGDRQMTFFEFREGKIARIMEYW